MMFLYRAGIAVARLAGRLVSLFPGVTEIPLKNLKVLFPDIDSSRLTDLCRKYLMHQFQVIFELFFFYFFPEELKKYVSADDNDLNRCQNHLKSGKAVIFLSMHQGNWELLGASLVAYGMPLSSVYLKSRSQFQGKILSAFRGKFGITLIDHDNVAGIIRIIRNKMALGLIADHDGGPDGIALYWNGNKISFPAGPARLGRKFELPVEGVFLLRKRDGTHRIVMKHLDISSCRDEKEISEKFLSFYQCVISKYPEQWLLFYDRFKERNYGRTD